MSQRSHIAISGSTAICPCSSACSAPSSARRERLGADQLVELVPERPRGELDGRQIERLEVDHRVVLQALALIAETVSE